MQAKPVLLFAYGNVSRGDDALAPLLLESIKKQKINQVAGHPLVFLTDYQIQVEHVMDLQGCARVLLMDAHQSLGCPFSFYPVTANAEISYTTHGMSPAALLHTYHQALKEEAPDTAMLAIQGVSFELGDAVSETARHNLMQANNFINVILQQDDFTHWDEALQSKSVE